MFDYFLGYILGYISKNDVINTFIPYFVIIRLCNDNIRNK